MPVFIKCLDHLKNSARQVCPHFYQKLSRRRTFVKYLVAGAFTGTLDLFSLFILHGVLRVGVVIATTGAYFASLGLSFYLQRVWTFNNNSDRKLYYQAGLYFGTISVNLIINGAGMHLLVNHAHIQYILAQLLVDAFLATESFVVYRFIVFRQGFAESDDRNS